MPVPDASSYIALLKDKVRLNDYIAVDPGKFRAPSISGSSRVPIFSTLKRFPIISSSTTTTIAEPPPTTAPPTTAPPTTGPPTTAPPTTILPNQLPISALDIRDNIVYGYVSEDNSLYASYTSLYIPDGVTRIHPNAFYEEQHYTGELRLPPTLTSIGGNAFFNHKYPGTLILPTSLKAIEYNAFQSTSFTSISLNEGLETLLGNAFAYCQELTGTIRIPSTVTTVGTTPFYLSNQITLIQYPSTFTQAQINQLPPNIPKEAYTP